MPARQTVLAILSAVAVCAWCGWASGFHQSTVPAFSTWSASLATVVAIDLLLWQARHTRRPALSLPSTAKPWPRPGQGGGGRALLGVSPWLILGLVVVAWEVLGIDTSPHQTHATISSLAQLYRPLDALLLLAWMLAGFGYGAARGRAPIIGPPRTADHGVARGGSLGAVVVVGHPGLVPALLLPQSRALAVSFWLLVVAAGVLIDLAARHSSGRLASGEEFLRLISGPPAARPLLVVAWTYSGWHLFAH